MPDKPKIPHRFPMLFVDRIVEATPERALGEKYVTVNEPYFRGHFPQAPVMPGVLVMESLFQLVWSNWGGEDGFRLCGIRKLKFRRSVLPGDIMQLEALPLNLEQQPFKFRCTARVEDKIAVEGELWVVRRPAKNPQHSLNEQREPVKA